MAAKKDIEKAVKLREFQRSVDKLLTPEDRDYLFYALKEYDTYKSVAKLMLALNSCLDSAEKLDLLPYIRDLIPKHDKRKFDNLAPYNRMAHPIRPDGPVGVRDLEKRNSQENSVRIIHLQRSNDSALGFSIRGGQEHELGIYVSHIESLSQAEKAGLQIGDQLIRVNGIDFERVSHASAVLVLRSHDNLKIEVKNTGKIPGMVPLRNSFVWVDAQGRMIDEVDGGMKRARHSIKRDERSPDRLLSSPDKRKVVLHSTRKKPLGFSIRGGNEYGLGIYISVIDVGSLSEEAGLRIGDQIMDVNGHSFLSILHFEAVHILRSYSTLIMTIKSLGKIPSLPQGERNEIQLEQSPITRRKSAEFVRSGSFSHAKTSKRPSSATITEEEEEEEEEEGGKPEDTSIRLRASSLKRSESERQQRPSALPTAGFDEVDSAKKARSNSFGSSGPNFSQRQGKTKKQMILSPLATHDVRASPSPTSSPDSGKVGSSGSPANKSKFFEKGLGTQMMLANASSQAKQLLFDKARRVLSEEGVQILREDLVQYEETGDVNQFVDCLISIFNTPEKMDLLREVRSVVKPTDIVRFDEKISPHELKAFCEKLSDSGSDDFNFDDTMDTKEDSDTEEGVELTDVRKQNGHSELFSGERGKSASLTFKDAGLFSLNTKTSMSAPELSEAKETKFSWHENNASSHSQQRHSGSSSGSSGSNSDGEGTTMGYYDITQSRRHAQASVDVVPQGNPVIIDIEKEAPYIGLAIKTTADNHVLVKGVRPGGAIDKDGFIQPGFEIIQVDNIRIRGKSYHDAAREIADAFKTEGPTVQFIVVPNYA